MAKVSGTYPSLSRGVNQQPFEARLDGQHGEQINMWSDPVAGLTRRRGTEMRDITVSRFDEPSYHQLTKAQQKEFREYIASWRTLPYTTDGEDFLIHYPTKAAPAWYVNSTGPRTIQPRITRKTDNNAEDKPVTMAAPGTALFNSTMNACAKGFVGGAQIGRHVLLYPNDTLHDWPTEFDAWEEEGYKLALEVRQGLPNTTYSFQYTYGGNSYTVTHTTPSSTYSGTLDTSDIPFSDPNYQKLVNDRVNAYNDAVTKWLTTAAQAMRPSSIAADIHHILHTQHSAHFPASSMNYIVNTNVILMALQSGVVPGDVVSGTSTDPIVLNYKTVETPDLLVRRHFANKVMQIKPERGEAGYYVKAIRDLSSESQWQYMSNRWEECPRTYVIQPPQEPWLLMTYAPSTGEVLCGPGTLTGKTWMDTRFPGVDPRSPARLPAINHRLVGDEDTSPTPAFYGKQVTWVGMFQDRLCFASGNVLNMSETGNYFNFWRTQTLTVPDNDPVEVFARGSENDNIRHSVIFDKSLLLFGERQQYAVDGRIPITPSTSNIIQSSAIEGVVDAPPVVGRDLVFFAKRREESTEVFQLEVGDVSDTTKFTGLGMQLADYIYGAPAQLLYISSPSMLFVRTDHSPNSIFVFRFIDQGNQRVMDSWSKFEYHPATGLIMSMFYHDDAVYIRTLRDSYVHDGTLYTGQYGGTSYEVIDRQSLLSGVPDAPYLDSARSIDLLWGGTTDGVEFHGTLPFVCGAFGKTKVTDPDSAENPYYLQGTSPAPSTPLAFNTQFADIPVGVGKRDKDYFWVGLSFPAKVELTSPVHRTPDGQPVLQGRLTIRNLQVYYKNAAGFTATVFNRYSGTSTALKFNGKVIDNAWNLVGSVPVTTGDTPVYIGREVQDYTCTLSARTWMPLSITRVTWTGQFFLNHRAG